MKMSVQAGQFNWLFVNVVTQSSWCEVAVMTHYACLLIKILIKKKESMTKTKIKICCQNQHRKIECTFTAVIWDTHTKQYNKRSNVSWSWFSMILWWMAWIKIININIFGHLYEKTEWRLEWWNRQTDKPLELYIEA